MQGMGHVPLPWPRISYAHMQMRCERRYDCTARC